MMDIATYYKEASEQLFIFYTSLIEAGFSSEQAFELVRTCMNNSAIENMMNSYEYKLTRKYERTRTAMEKIKENKNV